VKHWRKIVFSGVACLVLTSTPLAAQIFVSANDGKQVRAGDLVPGPFPDEVVTLTLDRGGTPRVIGRVTAPTTLNGPPVSVAVSRNGRLALVASSQRAGADGKLVPHGIVSAIDLRDPAQPRVIGQLELPPGTMGIGLLPDAKRALVASASDNSVSLIAIAANGSLQRLQTIALEAGSEPRDVVIARDGRSAYVVRFGDGLLTRLAIDSDGVRRTGDITVGKNPDGGVISRDGRFLYNSNFGGTSLSGTAGAISAVDLARGEMVAGIAVGPTPEHVTLSPDGRYLAAVIGNGSAFTRTAANFAEVTGRLKVLQVDGARLVAVAEAPIGHNCQGAAFSDDGRTILVQCAVEKTIGSFRFDGKTLTPVETALSFDARPAAIATAKSR
jgi:DNA-binding beta-propeller fold protein YncE